MESIVERVREELERRGGGASVIYVRREVVGEPRYGPSIQEGGVDGRLVEV